MDEKWTLPGVSKSDIGGPEPIRGPKPIGGPEPKPEKPAKPPRSANLFSFIVGLVAVAAIAASAWVYTETQRDLNRVATDIAQIRLSLQLFGQQRPGDIAVPATESLQDLSNRLAILEQNWRDGVSAAGTAALPATPGTAPASATTTASTGPQTDCIPQGTRFLVANGDSYPICGTNAVVDVTEVATSYVSFKDGLIVTAGGNAILTGTKCTIAVVSSGADGMTGYAELRVGC